MSGLARSAQLQAGLLLGMLGLMWLLELVDLFVFHHALDGLGIRPRTPDGLWGILLAPFLHGGFAHLIANSVPFLTLGWLVMLRGVGGFVSVTLIVMLVGGFGVWLTGAPRTVHIGASGLIFGYLGFLLLRGYFDRSLFGLLLSLVVGLLYGGALWGILPSQPGVSWQGHLFGFLAGILAARLLARRPMPSNAARPQSRIL